MPTLQEIRAKTPEYNDLSDQQFVDAFHQKFYSDMPKEELYKKINYNPSNVPRGTSSTFENQMDTLRNAQTRVSPLELIYQNPKKEFPEDLKRVAVSAVDAATVLPYQLLGLAYQLPSSVANIVAHPINSTRDLLGGVARGSQNLAAGLGEAGQFIGNLPLKALGVKNPANINIREELGLEGDNQVDLGKMIETENPDPLISTGGQFFGSGALGNKLWKLITGGAANAALQAKPDNRIEAATEGVVGGALPVGILKGLEALRPSKMFRGTLSPEELKKNLQITKGTKTPLGDVIQSPILKKTFENLVTQVPFSGANRTMQATAHKIENKGNQILSDYLGKTNPNDVPEKIVEGLIKQHDAHKKMKNSLYNNFNVLADLSGKNLDLSEFAKKANLYADAIKSTNILKTEPESKKLFNRLKNYTNPTKFGTQRLGSNGLVYTEKKYPTFKEANLLKGKLNELSAKASKSADPNERNLARVFGNLAASIKKDIRNNISDNPDLLNAYEKAEANYKNNYSKFLDKEIYKYISGDRNPEDIITKFIKTSPNADLSSSITRISNVLPAKEKKLLGYGYLSRALDSEGNLDFVKLGTAINKLKPKQMQALFDNSFQRQQLRDFAKLAHMNKESKNLMFNPHTGQRNMDWLKTMFLSLPAMMNGNLTAAAIPAVTIGAGRTAGKLLTNRAVRKNLIKAMIEDKKTFDTVKNRKLGAALSQALLQQGNN